MVVVNQVDIGEVTVVPPCLIMMKSRLKWIPIIFPFKPAFGNLPMPELMNRVRASRFGFHLK